MLAARGAQNKWARLNAMESPTEGRSDATVARRTL
jgi:hypothetical protein